MAKKLITKGVDSSVLVKNLNSDLLGNYSNNYIIPYNVTRSGIKNSNIGILITLNQEVNKEIYGEIYIKGQIQYQGQKFIDIKIPYWSVSNYTNTVCYNDGYNIGPIYIFDWENYPRIWFLNPETNLNNHFHIQCINNLTKESLVKSVEHVPMPTEGVEKLFNIPIYSSAYNQTGSTFDIVDLPATVSTLDLDTLPPIANVSTIILRYNGVVQDLDTYVSQVEEPVMPLPMNDEVEVSAETPSTLDLPVGVVPMANLDEYVKTPNNWLKIYVPSHRLSEYKIRYTSLRNYFYPINGNEMHSAINKDGVYILYYGLDNPTVPLFCKPDDIIKYDDKVITGALIIENGKILVVSPTEYTAGMKWGNSSIDNGAYKTDLKLFAIKDLNGKINNDNLKLNEDLISEECAVKYCADYEYGNISKGNWWLPSLGELAIISKHYNQINYALSLIPNSVQLQDIYWSSTEKDDNKGAWVLNLNNGLLTTGTKTLVRKVRPVTTIINNNIPEEFVPNAGTLLNDSINKGIGGRNYILNSNIPTTNINGSNIVRFYRIQEPLVDGEYYTLTIDAELGEGKNVILCTFDGSGSSFIEDNGNYRLKKIKDNIYRITAKYIRHKDDDNNWWINFHFGPYDSLTTCKVNWCKLEKGTLATDWTPALEDIVEEAKSYIDNRSAVDYLAYGVEWTPFQVDPKLTRVGNLAYHKTLPIQSRMSGCIFNPKEGKLVYWLNKDDWRWKKEPTYIDNVNLTSSEDDFKFTDAIFSTNQYKNQWVKIKDIPCQIIDIDTELQTATIRPTSEGLSTGIEYKVELGSVRNGYDGEVMVYIPEFYIKSWDTDTLKRVMISPTKIDYTWEYQPEIYVGAYRDTVLNQTVDNMGYLSTLEENTAISVVNIEDYCRGGNNNPEYDKYLDTDIFRTFLGKARSGLLRSEFRTYARKANKEILSYRQWKNIFYWLYVIEYANFNSQSGFNPELTQEGYRQGGLGTGLTSINASPYIGNNAICPNGYTDENGNNTSVKTITIPAVDYEIEAFNNLENATITNHYINDELIATCKKQDGKMIITNVPSENALLFYVTAWKISPKTKFKVTGLTDNQELIFDGNNSTVTTISQDGEIEVNWPKNDTNRNFRCKNIQNNCNIVVEVVSGEPGIITIPIQKPSAVRYRGIENIFGDLWTHVDGVLINSSAIKDESGDLWSEVYTTDNPAYYNDTDFSMMKMSGLVYNTRGNTIIEWNLGNHANIFPLLCQNVNESAYKCDTHWQSSGTGLRSLFLGGNNNYTFSKSGIGAFADDRGPTKYGSDIGFRTVFIPKKN